MKELKVIYDGYFFNLEKNGGISRYWYEIWSKLISQKDFKAIILSIPNQNLTFQYISDKKEFTILPQLLGKRGVVQNHPLLKSLNLSFELISKGINKEYIFHSTLYSYPFFKLNRPLIVTIHDLNIFTMPERYKMHHWDRCFKKDLSEVILRADAIISVSETTKQNILKFFPQISEKKIHTIYHGINQSWFTNSQDIQPSVNINYPYFLFVGGRNAYKNLDIILKAMQQERILSKETKLILVGENSVINKMKEQQKFEALGLKNRIIDMGLISDTELKKLYQFASALIFPSYGEGFGFPLLEAMASGCRVIASDIDIFKELGAKFITFFNPNNYKELANIMQQYVNNTNFDKIELMNYTKKFDWNISAEKHIDLYRIFA